MKSRSVVCVLWMGLSSAAAAYDFTQADALYEKRGDGDATILAARSAYEAAIGSVSGAELLYAVEQVGRLDSYWGEWIGDGKEPDKRIEIYNHCLAVTANLEPSKFGSETPQYYFYRALCLASWGKAKRDKGPEHWVDALKSSAHLRAAHDRMMDTTVLEEKERLYEGGGIYRVLGAVYYNLPRSNPASPGFVQDLTKAELYLKTALEADAYYQSSDPAQDSGENFVASYYHLAVLYSMTDRRDEARELIADAIAKFEGPEAPQKRMPENIVGVRNLRALLEKIDNS